MMNDFPKPSDPIHIKDAAINIVSTNGERMTLILGKDKYKGYTYDASTGLLYKTEVENETKSDRSE